MAAMSSPVREKKIGFAITGKTNEVALPNRDFWLSHLWNMVYEKSTKVCRKGLTKIVAPRVQKKNEMKQNADDIKQKQIWDQSISSSAMPLGMKIAIGIGGTATVAAGGVGATIGAVIGALAMAFHHSALPLVLVL